MINWNREKNKVLFIAFMWSMLYLMYAEPYLSGKLKVMQRNVTTTRAEVVSMKNSISLADSSRMKCSGLKKELDSLKKEFSRQSEVSVIGRNLNELAEAYGIRVANLSYGEPVIKGRISSYPIKMELSGNFFSIGDFIKETEARYSNISWKVSAMSTKKYPKLSAKLVLNIRKLG